MRLPLRARVTLVAAVLMATILALTGVLVYTRLGAELRATADDSLRVRAADLVDLVEREGGNINFPTGTEDQVTDLVFGDGTSSLLTPEELASVRGPTSFEATVALDEEEEVVRLLAVRTSDGEAVVIVGVAFDDQREALARLAALLWIGGPLALVFAVLAIWFLVGRTLRPIEAIRAEAATMSATELDRHLPVPDTGDEVERLATTLNDMLARIQDALERERRFVDDASHELRTPLANLKAELDLALRHSRTPQELEAALRSASEETDRMSRLAEDLLVLARAEHGRLPIRRHAVEVDALVRRAVEPFTVRAAGRGIALRIRVPGSLVAELDESRIVQAVGNLVENALRHSPEGGTVSVEATAGANALRLEVRDDGSGFPEGFLAEAFDAFARPDGGRGRPEGGTGLGLAIVRAVAEAHGGTATASNQPQGGAAVTLTLPVRSPDP